MGIENIHVSFDKPVNLTGDDITGRVNFSVTKSEEKIKSIKIFVSGFTTITHYTDEREMVSIRKQFFK